MSHCYESVNGAATIFVASGTDRVWLQRLWGLVCGIGGEDAGYARARGLAVLTIDGRRYEDDRLRLVKADFGAERAAFEWAAPECAVHLESEWTLCPATGIWSRQDVLHNRGPRPVTIQSALARFTFTPMRYTLYHQRSPWGGENDGVWQHLDTATVELTSSGGRTTEQATPYLCLKDADSGGCAAFHIVPCGNWLIRLRPSDASGELLPQMVLEIGLKDRDLALALPPGASQVLPEILIQALHSADPWDGSPELHRYASRHRVGRRPTLPVVYNTWCDQADRLEPERLRAQLAAAMAVGCEVFVVDAGWYGHGTGQWFQQVGHWQEKTDGAFKGRMAEFAEEVRAAGLAFGLWMEPERFAPDSPAVREHPEWFLAGPGVDFFPDLRQPEAYAFVKAEIIRLLTAYRLAWLKFDMNVELGGDGTELSGYYGAGWYRMLAELRAEFPQVIIEGCASGGLRADLGALGRFDTLYLSDTSNPTDMLRIYQGALLRLPPGRIGKWIVVYPSASVDGLAVLTAGHTAGAPRAAVGVDFAALVALPGVPGISGDLAGVSAAVRERLREHLAFHRTWRDWIRDSVAHLLTPPAPIADRSGWAAIQLQSATDSTSLVFVYRLEDGARRRWFPLRNLDAEGVYVIEDPLHPVAESHVATGRELMAVGLAVEVPQACGATLRIVSEKTGQGIRDRKGVQPT